MLTGLELTVFLGMCKAVRNEQEHRTKMNETYVQTYGEKAPYKTSMYINITPDCVYGQVAGKISSYPQLYALLYKLDEQGYIKYRAGHGRRKTYVALDHKGVNLVKQLKSKRA